MSPAGTRTAYDRLLDRYERAVYLGDVTSLLDWDRQVVMPEGGDPARSRQLSTVSRLEHEELGRDDVAALLDAVEADDLDEEQRAVVREIRREHERVAAVPSDVAERVSRARSAARSAWRTARADADWAAFAPEFESLLDALVERARRVDADRDPYEVLYEDGEPYLPLAAVERVLARLREKLTGLVDDVRDDGRELATPFASRGPYDEDEQFALNRSVLDALGYDWNRGRFDTAEHPFTAGTQFDVRVATRFDDADPIAGVTATLHEFGHASYTLGLPDGEYGTPIGQHRSHAVHESQARFWENHVGRSRAFWEWLLPRMRERFPGLDDVTVTEAYEAANRIDPDNCIRVEADELTYHLHVALRAEIERAVLDGELDVTDVPSAWGDRMKSYLGVRPADDAEGPLQDVQWTITVGAFQRYTVGSVLAAQLDAAMRADLPVDDHVRAGEFAPLREWLTEHVHRHGRRYETPDLVEVATGEPLTADYFLDYAREKFTDLYGL